MGLKTLFVSMILMITFLFSGRHAITPLLMPKSAEPIVFGAEPPPPYPPPSPQASISTAQFVRQGRAERVMSVIADQPFTFQILSDIKMPARQVNLYRASEQDLLEHLLYPSTKFVDPTYLGEGEQYQRSLTEFTPENRIQQLALTALEESLTLTLPIGIYFAQATNSEERAVGGAFFVANRTGLLLRQDDQKVVLAAFDAKTGQRDSSVIDIAFYALDESIRRLHYQKMKGRVVIPWPFERRLSLVVGKKGEELLLIPLWLPYSQADLQVRNDLEQQYKIFLHTDRPIYQPNDTIKFHGVARRDVDSLYQLPPAGVQVRISLNDGFNPSMSKTVVMDQHGNFAGEFPAPKSGSNSMGNATIQHSLYAQILSQSASYSQGFTNFDVAAYTKPTFDITATALVTEVVRGEPISVTLTGAFFNGAPLAHEAITYTWYTKDFYEVEKAVYNRNFNVTQVGGMCGAGFFPEWYGESLKKEQIVSLDQDGKATLQLDTSHLHRLTSQSLTLIATKTDPAGNVIIAAAATVVHGARLNLFFLPSADSYRVDEEVVAPLYVEDLSGDKAAHQQVQYRFVEPVWISDQYTETVLFTGIAQTDGNGTAILHFSIPAAAEGKYLWLIAETLDGQSAIAQGRKPLTIQETKSTVAALSPPWATTTQTYLKIASRKNSFVVGEQILLDIQSPAPLDVLMTTERGRVYDVRSIHLQRGANRVTIPVDEHLSPSITVVFSFFVDGNYHTEGLALNVPAMHKLLTVNITPDKSRYLPNETAQLKLTAHTQTGAPVIASLSLAVVDKAIFALRKNAAPAMHSSFYYFRPRQTNAASSLTPIGQWLQGWGRGGGGGGGSGASKLVDTLYWNPNLTTDSNGAATVAVPLGSTITTWKANVFAATDQSFVGQGEADLLVAP